MTQILLVDNEADTGTMLRLALQGLGYEVNCVRNGQEAIKLLKNGHNPALIISNLTLPVMDGLTLLDHVRSDADCASIPFVAVSAIISEDSKRVAFERGADAFLRKPFRYEDVNNVLNNLGVLPARV
jgi:CheY-like chemotaxis protein